MYYICDDLKFNMFQNRHKLGNNYEYEGEFYRKL